MEYLKHLFHMLQMLHPGIAKHKDIIEKYNNIFFDEGFEDPAHQGPERRRRVGEAEWYHQELKVSPVCPEHRLVDVVRVHADLMVTVAEVELFEESCAAQLVDHRLLIDRVVPTFQTGPSTGELVCPSLSTAQCGQGAKTPWRGR
jgi:hypothetical protein